MAYDDFLNLLGVGIRGSKLLLGTYACESQAVKGRLKMLILDAGASERTKKKFLSLCKEFSVELVMIKEGDFLRKTGMSYRIVGVTDAAFKNALSDKLEHQSEPFGGDANEQTQRT